MPRFKCQVCNAPFTVSEAALERYPGWTPKYCRQHSPSKKKAPARRSAQVEENLTRAQVLRKYHGGPQNGLFTDGSCHPNPGPGGWGVVWVCEGEILAERHGYDPDTTNNRMELTAIIEAFKLLSPGSQEVVFSDSRLCVNTLNDWAPKWERNGWRRSGGPIKNLDLVKEAYALHKSLPKVEVRWIAAHSGNRWNEYADALSTGWMRDEL